MRIRSFLTLGAAAALVVGLWGSQPAAAEEDRGIRSTIFEADSYSYRLFQYPSSTTEFFMYPKGYVSFDAVNGKQWKINSDRSRYQLNHVRTGAHDVFPFLGGTNALYPEGLSVSFYTPDMRLLKSYERVRMDREYSVPHDGNDYERLIVKIESKGKENFDIRMSIWDPIDSVNAEPVAPESSRR